MLETVISVIAYGLVLGAAAGLVYLGLYLYMRPLHKELEEVNQQLEEMRRRQN